MIFSRSTYIPALISLALTAITIPAYAEYECSPPKYSYSDVRCTNDKQYFVAYDSSYNLQKLLDNEGRVVADLKGYDDIDSFGIVDNVFGVLKNEKIGYMNTKGKLVVPIIYESMRDPDDKYDETWVEAPSNGRILVAKNGKLGIITTNNKIVMPFTNKYNVIESFGEGLAPVMNKSFKWGFINTKGKEVIPATYDGTDGSYGGAYGFSQGLAGMLKGKKWGYITKTGKVAVPFIYDEIRPFSENLAGVRKGNKWGFINGANKTIIPFTYLDKHVKRYSSNYNGATYFVFNEGVAHVATINDKDICINKSGKKVNCR